MTRLLIHTASRHGRVRLVILLVAAIVIGAGASLVVFGRGLKPGRTKAAAHGTAPKPAEPPQYVDMGSFLVNVASADQLRYLKVNITLVVVPTPAKDKHPEKSGTDKAEAEKGKKAVASLAPGDDVVARDTIVRVLSSEQFEDLRQPRPRESVKALLRRELGVVLQECQVINVLFTSFVMQ